ncbi:TPA: GNAT family N-acetyltransferase, partial [Streptococcus suis]
MKYYYEYLLPNGVPVIIKNAKPSDAIELFNLFNKTHSETDFLTTYPDESHFDLEKEQNKYQKLYDSENSCEILAVIDNKIIGSASLNSVSLKDKEKHRGVIGLSILKEYWG